jgi:hypothetical protein
VSVAEWVTLVELGVMVVVSAGAGSAAWWLGRGVLYGWWMTVLVLAVVGAVLVVVFGVGVAYWVLWLMLVGALAGTVREQAGRGSWWLVAGYELVGPGLVAAVTAAGGMPVGLGVGLVVGCGLVVPWCLLPGFDQRGVR